MDRISRRQFIKLAGSTLSYLALETTFPRSLAFAKSVSRKRRTYVIALDGMPAQYLNFMESSGKVLTPNLKRIAEQGARFINCYSMLPALTVCNHTSIISGAPTGVIGMYGAGAYYGGLDEKGGAVIQRYRPEDIQAETLYDLVKEKDRRAVTGVITGKGWVGEAFHSSKCDVLVTGKKFELAGEPPGYVLGGYPDKDEKQFPPRVCFPKNASEHPANCLYLPGFYSKYMPSDVWVKDGAIQVIKRFDPDFLYILLAGMDDAGHAYGNFTDPANINSLSNYDAMQDQLRITDACVGELYRFLEKTGRLEDAVLVITADHGMSTNYFKREVKSKKLDISLMKDLLKKSDSVVDIRSILRHRGLKMRAYDYYRPAPSSWAYEWCGAEGPNAYLFGIEKGYKEKIINALNDFNKHHPEHPIWEIVDSQRQKEGLNSMTGIPFQLYNQKLAQSRSAKIKWPDLFIFLKPHYMIPFYYDQAVSGGVIFMKKVRIPIKTDITFVPGFHGTYSEQHVPLVFYGKGVPSGIVSEEKVTTLQIAPTLCKLNKWRRLKHTTAKPLPFA